MTRSVTAAALVLLTALVGCTASGAGGDERRLTVLVASSLVDVVDDLAMGWGKAEVDVVDAGSQVLAAQVRAGAPVDVLLLADEQLALDLAEEGVAGAPSVVARNSLVLITPPGGSVTRIEDLTDPAVRVVLADETVPLGAATRHALGADAAAVLAGVDSFEDAARSVLAKVISGEADAAVVYATDAAAAGPAVRVVAWQAGAAEPTVATAQLVDDSPLARSLLKYITSADAHEVWTAVGFVLP